MARFMGKLNRITQFVVAWVGIKVASGARRPFDPNSMIAIQWQGRDMAGTPYGMTHISGGGCIRITRMTQSNLILQLYYRLFRRAILVGDVRQPLKRIDDVRYLCISSALGTPGTHFMFFDIQVQRSLQKHHFSTATNQSMNQSTKIITHQHLAQGREKKRKNESLDVDMEHAKSSHFTLPLSDRSIMFTASPPSR